MIALDSTEGRALVTRLAREPSLIGLDYDGTLAPIVEAFPDAVLPAQTRAILARVAHRFPTVVISGRSRADLAARVSGLPLAAIVGNHGFEPPPPQATLDLEQAGLRVRAWLGPLAAALAGLQRIEIEDKRLSLAIHYRLAADHELAERVIREATAGLHDARLIPGARCVNLVPRGAPNKGDALLALKHQHGCALALFVGDDVTDEDAFAAPGVIGVRVGAAPEDGPPSRAAFYVERREEVDALLDRLAKLRD